jgi:hypothetical protein
MAFVAYLYTNRSQIDKIFKWLLIHTLEFVALLFITYLVFKFIRRNNTNTDNQNIDQNILNPIDDKKLLLNVEKIKEVKEESRYRLNNGLVTPTEEKFLKVLEGVVGDRYRIVPQVQLSRIMKPVDSNNRFTNYKDFNLIKAKSIDFVLYDKDLIKPHVAIELDDRSHGRYDRIKRDEFVNKIMEEVGLKLIRIPVSYNYDLEWLRREIFNE